MQGAPPFNKGDIVALRSSKPPATLFSVLDIWDDKVSAWGDLWWLTLEYYKGAEQHPRGKRMARDYRRASPLELLALQADE